MDNQFWYLAYLRSKQLWDNEDFINYQRILMQKVKNSLNATDFPKQGEVFTLPSLTIPDQSLTVRELMDRFARGLPLDGQRVPIFEGEEESMPDFRRMDLSEIEEYRNAVQQELDEVKAKLTDKMKKATTEKEVKELKEQLAKFKDAEKLKELQEKEQREQSEKEPTK